MKKRKLTLLLIAVFTISFAQAQNSKGFNYQAIVKDAQGNKIAEKTVGVKISLQDAKDNIYYAETHSKKTDKNAVLALVIGEGKSVDAKKITDVKWHEGSVYIQLAIDTKGGTDYKKVGNPTMLQSVPYALYAEQSGRLIQSKSDASDEEPIFEVKNKKGETVFAVYQNGATVFLDTTKTAKGARGGFAVATRGIKKAPAKEMFTVTGDNQVKVIVDETTGKGARGGFAVATRGIKKAPAKEMFTVTGDNQVKVIVNGTTGKGARGGFAVATRGIKKAADANILNINNDSIRFYIEKPAQGTKGARGGFAVATRGIKKGAKEDELFYMSECQTVFNICETSEDGFKVQKPGTGNQAATNLLTVKPTGDVEAKGQIASVASSHVQKIYEGDAGNFKLVQIGTGVFWTDQNASVFRDSIEIEGTKLLFSNKVKNNAYYDMNTATNICNEIIPAPTGGATTQILMLPDSSAFISLLEKIGVSSRNPAGQITMGADKFAKLITLIGNTWGNDFPKNDPNFSINSLKMNVKKHPHRKVNIKQEPASGKVTAISWDEDYVPNFGNANDEEVASWWINTMNGLGLVSIVREKNKPLGNYRVIFKQNLTTEQTKNLLSSVRCIQRM